MTLAEHARKSIFQLEIQTLSPLYIGTQDLLELSPYADFVVTQDQGAGPQVQYLDKEAMIGVISAADRMEDYLNDLGHQFDNNRSNFNLHHFLKQCLQHPANEGKQWENLVTYTHQAHGLKPTSRVPISPTIASKGTPYLPGSSLKGAIRTAILYKWLCDDTDGRKVLKQSFRSIQRLVETNRKAGQLRRNDYRGRKNLEREVKRILRDVLPEEALFGKIVDSEARRIRVADSRPVAKEELEVYLAERQRLRPQSSKFRQQENSIPQPRQAFPPGTDLVTEVQILHDFKNQSAFGYLTEAKSLAYGLNRFAKDAIDNEIYQLKIGAEAGGDYARRANALIKFYEETLLPHLDNDEPTFLLRIGAGKTVYDNSLLLALIYGDEKQKEEEYYFRIIREAIFGVREGNDLFPVTRTLGPGGECFGWCLVKIDQ